MKLFSLLPRVGVVILSCLVATLHAADAPEKNGYTVVVEMRVNAEGKIESATVVDSEDVSAGGVLTKMAVAMALRMKVPPRQKDGKPAGGGDSPDSPSKAGSGGDAGLSSRAARSRRGGWRGA